MPFGDDEVQINYRAVVTGMQDVDALRAQNSDLQNQTSVYTTKVNEASVAVEKHKNVLLQTHTALRQLHRELYVGVAIFGLVAAGLGAMAKGSESAQIGLDQLTSGATKFFGNIGTWTAKATAYWGAIFGGATDAQAHKIADDQVDAAKSFDTRIKLLNMEANLYKTKGDELLALKTKQAAESLTLDKDSSNKSYQAFKEGLDKQHDAELEAYRLHSMGLKQQTEIDSEFRKSIGGDFTSGGADVLNKLLTGQKQTPMDMLKSFTDGFAKTISSAISESFFSSLSSGKGFGGFFTNIMDTLTGKKHDPVKDAVDKTNVILSNNDKILAAIQDCVCRTASATEAMAACGCPNSGPTSATITPGKISTAARLAGALSGISSIAGGLSGLPGLVGGVGGGGLAADGSYAPGYSGANPPTISFGNAPIGHSGFEVPQFPSGGEVPIMAQPGEFVVRRSAAQDNKDTLKAMNSGARQSKQTQNVYFITSNDAKSFSDMLASPSAQSQMEVQIIKAILKNGQLRDTIKNFGRG